MYRSFLIHVIILILCTLSYGQVKYQGEKTANTRTDYTQDNPDVKSDSLGNFVIVWQSYFYPQSTNQYNSIVFRKFDSTGTALTDELPVDLNANAKNQNFPKVALQPNGGFVITWGQQSMNDTISFDVYARRFDANGNPLGASFKVNTSDTLNQAYPDIASDANGNFVIVWEQQIYPDSTYDIYAQLYNADGTPIGSNFLVNTYTTSDQWKPAVSMNEVGDFAVGWASKEQDGSQWGIYIQRYNADGTTFGSERRVNTYTPQYQRDVDVALNNNNMLVVVWQSGPGPIDGSDYGVYAKMYNSSGDTLWDDILVNDYIPDDQRRPYVDLDDHNHFLVVWKSNLQDGSGQGVYARRVDENGNYLSDEFRVNTITENDQYRGVATIRDGGDFIVAFSSYVDSTTTLYDIKFQIYRMAPVFSALPQISFDEEQTYAYPLSDYFDYVDDENDADSTLSWQTFNGAHVTTSIMNDSVFVTPEVDFFGTDSFMVVVTDPDGLTDTTYQTVTVNNLNDPPQIVGLPDLTDMNVNDSTKLKMEQYAQDSDTPYERLTWTFTTSGSEISYNYNSSTDTLTIYSTSSTGDYFLYATLTDDSSASDKDTILVRVSDVSAVEQLTTLLPKEFVVEQNYPNPFNPTTTLRFGLPEAASVRLEVYNVTGQRVASLEQGDLPAGFHTVQFKAGRLPSGMYYYKITAGTHTAVKRMLLVK